MQQAFNQPDFDIDVDRTKAGQVGLTQRDVATNLLISLSGSFQTTPAFWLNPKTGVSYPVATQTPQYRVSSRCRTCKTSRSPGQPGAIRRFWPTWRRFTAEVGAAVVSHYDVPAGDRHLRLGAGARSRRRGRATSRRLLDAGRRRNCHAARASSFAARSKRCTPSYFGLLGGLAFAIMLVYLLIVVNFQSWLDPFIIIFGAAGGAGRDRLDSVRDAYHDQRAGADRRDHVHGRGDGQQHPGGQLCARSGWPRQGRCSMRPLEAGFTRFRPVLMTALAMIIGMVPMALGLGEGGEQNAPLGRAVIGGLLFATVATLFFVPSFFSLLHGRRSRSALTAPKH